MSADFTKINNPHELYDYLLKNIQYGINETYQNDQVNDHLDKWHLQTELDLLDNKYGLCFDYVELERTWFNLHHYEYKTIFLIFALDYPNNYSNHTTLLYKLNNKWYNFEVADYHNQGIHEYDTFEEGVTNIKNKLIEYNKITNQKIINTLKVYEYPKPNKKYNFNDYIEYLVDSGIEI